MDGRPGMLCLRGRILSGKIGRDDGEHVAWRKAGLTRRSHDRSVHREGGEPPLERAGKDNRRRWDSIRSGKMTDTRACDASCIRAGTRTSSLSCKGP